MRSNISIDTVKVHHLYFTHVRYEIDGKNYDSAAYGKSKRIAETRALSELPEFLRKKLNEG